MNLYNEIEPKAAQTIRNLISAGEIPPGEVSEKSIKDITAADIAGFQNFHTFAGIGGWPLALKLAGWPTEHQIWTGSCPCQPYSTAGKGEGDKDPRNLWPDFYRLIRECRPATVIGEQVSAAIGHGWLDGVFDDLEREGYACGAVVFPACSVGAPHIRQRIYWMAYRDREQDCQEQQRPEEGGRERDAVMRSGCGTSDGMGDGNGSGYPERIWQQGDDGSKIEAFRGKAPIQTSPWSDYYIIPCSDGKSRRSGSGIFPLAHGLPRSMATLGSGLGELAKVAGLSKESLREARTHRSAVLKGMGNAIVLGQAVLFCEIVKEITNALV
ncbi:MAG: DNA cytosine methyltransferase [Patescibacteria group bacterium]|nr:DNA cytosine methyltransferase [Patescibacteria group bacterium]